MTDVLPSQLRATFTSDWELSHDGRDLDQVRLDEMGYGLFPWRIDSPNPWWARPLKLGEVGCAIAHIACWSHAANLDRGRPALVLEDDAVLVPDFMDRLQTGIADVDRSGGVDLLYLGRQALEQDRPAIPGFVSPGYSHCSYAYVVTQSALNRMLEARLERSIVPVDEFLPALYMDHPRPDVRSRFPRRLTALAFEPPLVLQLPKQEAGSDTEDSYFVNW
jgi:collagen beta-1,O-galactosyltransferase